MVSTLIEKKTATPTVVDTGKVGQDGRVIHPQVGTTEDGEYPVALMDEWGRQQTEVKTGEDQLFVLQEILAELKELRLTISLL